MSWSADLQKLCTKGGMDIGRVCQGIKIELFSGIVQDTRVDTGRLKGNWQTQESTKPTGTLERLDPTGSAVLADVQKASPDGVTFFVNNLPYAKVYEEKDAMVGRNVARVRQTVRERVRSIK